MSNPVELQKVCAWCGKWISGPRTGPITHGMCRECFEKEMPKKKNPDSTRRGLERRFQAGDRSALPALIHELRRDGRVSYAGHPILWEGPVTFSGWLTPAIANGRVLARASGDEVAVQLYTKDTNAPDHLGGIGSWTYTPVSWVTGVPEWLVVLIDAPPPELRGLELQNPLDTELRDLERAARAGDMDAAVKLDLARERLGQPSVIGELESGWLRFDAYHMPMNYEPVPGVLANRIEESVVAGVEELGVNLFSEMLRSGFWLERARERGPYVLQVGWWDNRDPNSYSEMMLELRDRLALHGFETKFEAAKFGGSGGLFVYLDASRMRLAEALHPEYIARVRAARTKFSSPSARTLDYFRNPSEQGSLFGGAPAPTPPASQGPIGGTTKRVQKPALYKHKKCKKVWRVVYTVDVDRWKTPGRWGLETRTRSWWWAFDPTANTGAGRWNRWEGPPATPCPECGKLVHGQAVHGTYSDKIPCGAKCVSATGPNCECACAGANHGSAWG